MEMGRNKGGSCRCRQRFLGKAKSRSKGTDRNNNYFPLPADEQRSQYQGGLRSRMRTFCRNKIRGKTKQSTVRLSLNLPPSTARSNKRAVLCGITYNNWKRYRLKGTTNDVKNMRDLLITKFGYAGDCIRVLTEEETNRQFIPTRKNIEDSLRWLVKDCQPGDSLVFFYSGHGLRVPDFNNDEVDGFDETICPLDFKEAGMIVDNDLNNLIVRPLTHGVTLHAIVDACHSGTILDLHKVYNSVLRKWEDSSPPSGVYKGTNGGLEISISACLDNQAAADTSAFTSGKMNGVLTYILAEILKKLPGPTYGDLFDLIRETIENFNQSGCLANTRILRRLFDSSFSQTALLSSTAEFDVYKKHLFL
ncbi:Detected protein of confused Function [Hibiscus syriacus]|uniref:Detected protein of confused Function n=1 Tax=Hibiscus syriacus TaxID=106335 RepID=A0A6A3A175_HIBSY|nr:metacaspase-1-like [Hibiscus syriacus]KAE8697908.1 Detected protein of confused Function [Hibiscus syriacus]